MFYINPVQKIRANYHYKYIRSFARFPKLVFNVNGNLTVIWRQNYYRVYCHHEPYNAWHHIYNTVKIK